MIIGITAGEKKSRFSLFMYSLRSWYNLKGSTEQTLKMSTFSINKTSLFEYSEYNPPWNKLVVCCLCVIGLCGNIIVCLTIWKATFLHNSTNYLIANLATTDAFVCVFAVCRVLTSSDQIPISSTIARQLFCSLISSELLWWMSVGASTIALVLLSFERFIGIVHPLRYKQFIIKRRLIIVIILQWVFGLLTNFYLPVWIIYDERIMKCTYTHVSILALYIGYVLQHIISYLLPVLTLIYLYIRMFKSLKNPLLGESNTSYNVQRATEFQRARKNIVVNLIIVTILFIICLTPGQVVFFVTTLIPKEMSDITYNEAVTQIAAYILPLCNSVLNPIVYSFRYKQFQKALRLQTFKCFFPKTQHSVKPTVHLPSH